VTIACKALDHVDGAKQYGSDAQRNSESWKAWRGSEKWQQWAAAMAPAVAARRRLLRLLGDKRAVRVLVTDVAPRFRDRKGGYTRVVRLATPRLGDAGPRAILEFVGVRDRQVQRSEKPAFSDESAETAKA
jgi:large subunit ribosomal protein L17